MPTTFYKRSTTEVENTFLHKIYDLHTVCDSSTMQTLVNLKTILEEKVSKQYIWVVSSKIHVHRECK